LPNEFVFELQEAKRRLRLECLIEFGAPEHILDLHAVDGGVYQERAVCLASPPLPDVVDEVLRLMLPPLNMPGAL